MSRSLLFSSTVPRVGLIRAGSQARDVEATLHAGNRLHTLAWLRRQVYSYFLQPRSSDEDARCREYIVNVLLCGLALTAVLKLLYVAIHPEHLGFDAEEDSFLAGLVVFGAAFGLWKLSRAGHYSAAAFSLLALLMSEAVRLTLRWSFELPVTQLMYALVIVVAGVVLAARAALAASALLTLVLLTLSYYQISDHLQPRTDWLRQQFQMTDAIGYAAILGIIVLVSWLTNREIRRSLSRAYASEAALSLERDTLEQKVAERTRELQEMQLLRTAELQRFAEIGRLSTNLLHEIANPLTAASLNLAQLDCRESEFILQAQGSLRQLERYIDAARRQIKHHGDRRRFNVQQELEQIARIMLPLARQAGIELSIDLNKTGLLHGDPVKFSQLIANLIANAIDAYSTGKPCGPKRIKVTIEQDRRWLHARVSDFGKGITPAEMPHLFEPFFTTKSASKRSLGIGLTMVRRIAEEDFHGDISVDSSPERGTHFNVRLRLCKDSGGPGYT